MQAQYADTIKYLESSGSAIQHDQPRFTLTAGWWIIPGIACGLLFWIFVGVTAFWMYSSINEVPV